MMNKCEAKRLSWLPGMEQVQNARGAKRGDGAKGKKVALVSAPCLVYLQQLCI